MLVLKLHNFRCYENTVIELPLSGSTLIKGESGVGKSTILNAIFFAYFGKIEQKCFTHGKTTCSVTLENPTLDLIIKRSCGPNLLQVTYKNKLYEDIHAQSIIQKKLGCDIEQFHLSSYFDQKKHSSVLSMSPGDRLEFIQTISNDNEAFNDKIDIKN